MQKVLSVTKSPGEKEMLGRDWPKYVLGNPPKSIQTKIKTRKLGTEKLYVYQNQYKIGLLSEFILCLYYCVLFKER